MNNLGEEVTNEIIEENFETKDEKIDHLKDVSDTIKTNPKIKSELNNDFNKPIQPKLIPKKKQEINKKKR